MPWITWIDSQENCLAPVQVQRFKWGVLTECKEPRVLRIRTSDKGFLEVDRQTGSSKYCDGHILYAEDCKRWTN